jgi:hypothetical protein
MGINLDTYYRGLAAERLQRFADELMVLSGEAEQAEAHEAALHLADLATQLLDMGVALHGRRLPPEPRG